MSVRKLSNPHDVPPPTTGNAARLLTVPQSVVDDMIQRITIRIARGLARFSWITPNRITTLSAILGGGIAGGLIYFGWFKWAAVVVILSGIFDGLDGDLARTRNMVTSEGALLDSVLDRYVDFLLVGAMILVSPESHLWPGLFALLGSTTVPYIRARSEAQGKSTVASVGSRSIRMILIIVSLLLNQLFLGLVAIALVSNIAAIHRLIHGLSDRSNSTNSQPVEML